MAKTSMRVRLAGALTKAAAFFSGGYSASVLRMSNFTSHKFTDFKSYMEALGHISSLAKSIDVIDCYAQMAGWGLYRDDEKLETNPADLVAVIKKPNRWNDFALLNSYMIYDLCITGNAILAMYGMQNNGAKVREVQRLYPQYVGIEKDSITKIKGYAYGYAGTGSFKYRPEEIIHVFRAPNPSDEYWGLGPIQANEKLFDHAIDLNVMRDTLMDNGAVPSGILSFQGAYSAVEREKLQKDFNTKYGGRDNAGKTLVLGGGATYERIGLTPDEIKLLDDQVLTHREIFMLYGIPPFLRNLSADDNPKYDNIFQQEITFRQIVIAPILKKLAQGWDQVVKSWDQSLEFRFDDVTDRVSPENIERWVKIGIVTPDQAREMAGMEPTNRPAMQKFYVSMGLISIEDLSGLSDPSLIAPGGKPSKVTPAEEAATAADQAGVQALPPEVARAIAGHAGKRRNGDRLVANGTPRESSWRAHADGGWQSTPAEGVWTGKELSDNSVIARVQRDFLRLSRASQIRRMGAASGAFKRFIEDQENRIVENLREVSKSAPAHMAKAGSKELVDLIFRQDLEDALFVSVGSAFWQAGIETAYANVGDILTVALSTQANRALAARVNLLRRNGPRVNDTTRTRLGELLTQGIEEGLTPGDLAMRVQEGLRMYNSPRPVTIARNELAEAYRQGNRQAMTDAQIVSHVSVIGCEAAEESSPEYNGRSTCNITDVPVSDIDQLVYHVNHTGAEVPSRFRMPEEG